MQNTSIGLPDSPLGGDDGFTSPVTPGTGWPDDLATPDTAVAGTPDDVRRLSGAASSISALDAAVSVCRACPRLVQWREEVAVAKRRSFADQPYWGRPISGWGDEQPAVLVVGLAPAAHGGNRTGRIFTGDRSGDWLFAALHRAGLATLPTSEHAGDGQRLLRTRMVAAVRCAPPANAPTPEERDTCAPWLDRELALVADSLAGRRGAGRVCVAGRACRAPPGRACGAPTATEVWARRRGRDRGPAGHRVVPPQSAEHLHRALDRAHVRPRVRAGGGARRPPLPTL